MREGEGGGYNLREGGRVSLAQLNEERTIADWDLWGRWQLEKQPKQHLHTNTHTQLKLQIFAQPILIKLGMCTVFL